MSTLFKLTMIKKLTLVACAGLVISACSSTMEGMGKDLQNMGNSMGGSGASSKTQNQNNQSQTKGKDVVVTPVN
ncbi:hypothetical protein SAMN06295945_0854 [Polynucleobacter meluiroseus]|uniref:Entericidin EcnA/B family protein n=1 Tax=Polynucleobacter meluiroseus TaxID=1938814 RepID=A0A240DZZ4_9BURK|nr:hypothetical protein [Polynucleobacter meluiroseus]SNX28522.1 hypothetical protein SAMN06295945_0854 [Polynucleobacter meluiroseus]